MDFTHGCLHDVPSQRRQGGNRFSDLYDVGCPVLVPAGLANLSNRFPGKWFVNLKIQRIRIPMHDIWRAASYLPSTGGSEKFKIGINILRTQRVRDERAGENNYNIGMHVLLPVIPPEFFFSAEARDLENTKCLGTPNRIRSYKNDIDIGRSYSDQRCIHA